MSPHIYIEGMKDWLARSAPLPIPISTLNRTDNPDWDEMSPIFDELLKISPRWRSFRIYGPVPLAFLRRMGEYEKEKPRRGRSWLGSQSSIRPRDYIILRHHPAPSEVEDGRESALQYTLDSAHKLPLSLDASSPPELSLVILARCSNLVNASIFIYSPAALPELEIDIFTLHQLSTLSFDLSLAPGNFMLLLHLGAPR
ncbi:hypothetical protein B0H14DRAFT_685519 [Mycena olivaceomarginata]|nr:hypothetical protein B0H14DRAFT_685519 [Mycena olivaceomarginata]